MLKNLTPHPYSVRVNPSHFPALWVGCKCLGPFRLDTRFTVTTSNYWKPYCNHVVRMVVFETGCKEIIEHYLNLIVIVEKRDQLRRH